MIALFDTFYHENIANTAFVLLQNWPDELPCGFGCSQLPVPDDYTPGQFYKRELPCLLHALQTIDASVALKYLVIDGYVTLGGKAYPGLGGHLHHALNGNIPVIGVAKNPYAQSGEDAIALYRGASHKPLFITSMGVEPALAATWIQQMHGPYRIPNLLKKVDQLSRIVKENG